METNNKQIICILLICYQPLYCTKSAMLKTLHTLYGHIESEEKGVAQDLKLGGQGKNDILHTNFLFVCLFD